MMLGLIIVFFMARQGALALSAALVPWLLELGIISWFVMCIAILVSAWKVVKKLKGSPCFPIAFAINLYGFVMLLPMTFTSMVAYEDFVTDAYCWTLLGILFR